ncbi:MAG: FG-GAP-like repeat-containing protein [Planctomycetota bacterium]|nr:FG-GAP-like repeat-containing protein [Planctomycetota bacterium]
MLNPQQSSTNSFFTSGRVIFVIAFIAGGIIAYLFIRPPTPERSTRLSAESIRELINLRNVGIAHLENDDFEPAEQAFRKIAELVPDEKMGRWNLAICTLKQIAQVRDKVKNEPPAARDAAISKAVDAANIALQQLLAREPQSPMAYFLAAQLALELSATPDFEHDPAARKAYEHLCKAISLDSSKQNIAIRYALFNPYENALRSVQDTTIVSQMRSALRQAFEAQPDNLILLRYQLLDQSHTEDPEIAKTVEHAKNACGPLKRAQGKRLAFDPIKMLDAIATAAQENDWKTVNSLTFPFTNRINKAEFNGADLKRCTPDTLEFVVFDFSQSFYRSNPAPPTAQEPPLDIHFQPQAAQDALQTLANGRQLRLVDFDLDDRVDVAVLRNDSLDIFVQDPADKSWSLLGSTSIPKGMRGFFEADLFLADKAGSPTAPERPGIPDSRHSHYMGFVVYGDNGVSILRNNLDQNPASPILVEVDQSEDFRALRQVQAVAAIDIEHDGDLDLIVSAHDGISIWSNYGETIAFENLTEFSRIPEQSSIFTSLIVVDWDRDMDLDVVLGSSDSQISGYLENILHGRFVWQPFEGGFEATHSGQQLSLLESDGNASWDLLASGPHGVQLLKTSTAGNVRHKASLSLSPKACDGNLVWDCDNDGASDLLLWSSDGLEILRGQTNGEAYQSLEGVAALVKQPVLSCDTADIDNDGDLDLAVLTDEGIILFQNEGGNKNNWLAINMRGIIDIGRMNHYGYGTLLEIKSNGRYQAQVVARRTSHFGIGKQSAADVLRVLSTTGVPQNRVRVKANQLIHEKMVQKTSCPYAYTWNGTEFVFLTDLLWAAPLGLQTAEGTLAPSRPWEHLLIEGKNLQLRDGSYWIQITEELWETAYLDEVRLIAIDHPQNTEIYTNEKVGPPTIAKPHIHTVRQRRLPELATDSQGRDVKDIIGKRDGRYLQGFNGRFRKGLVSEHYLELNLGKLNSPETITLFLTGWINPTDISSNVGIAQDPQLSAPRPPAIQVVDKQGIWCETIPFTGFPGGKTKTIAIDLSNAFLCDDYRLRIITSQEICWDEVFFSVDEKPVSIHQVPLELRTADLHFRGFSQRVPHPGNGPEDYDYQNVSRAPKWAPLHGRFTRYGDVRELLQATDNRLVVIGSGDEVTLEFAGPGKPPPDGWTRDFVLYNAGWDKDGDLNTILGQSSEPLPFQEMSSYPYPAHEGLPDEPLYRDYLDRYQTRRQDLSEFWKWVQRYRAE